MPVRLLAPILAAVAALAVAAPAGAAPRPLVKTWKVHYLDHSGKRRAAYVVLPAWYGKHRHPRIPLIISPHGRGLTGRTNARLWGALPARGSFAVVNPDGTPYSWGSPGQIEDLAHMPEIVRRTLPWVRIDSSHVYAFGGSMGGQETLLLLARHPRLLAGAAAFDSVTDFARQYRNWPRIECRRACKRAWRGALGRALQSIARQELGGTPKTVPGRYARRSPISQAQRIANSCVPLQLWWSVADRVVLDQQQQSGRLFWQLRRLNPVAPVSAFVGNWIHSREMRAKGQLPLALAEFGLLPEPSLPGPQRYVPPPVGSDLCSTG